MFWKGYFFFGGHPSFGLDLGLWYPNLGFGRKSVKQRAWTCTLYRTTDWLELFFLILCQCYFRYGWPWYSSRAPLLSIGISEILMAWLKSYLWSPCGYVVWFCLLLWSANHMWSSQGLFLGPLLYVLCTANFAHHLIFKMHMYTDDI